MHPINAYRLRLDLVNAPVNRRQFKLPMIYVWHRHRTNLEREYPWVERPVLLHTVVCSHSDEIAGNYAEQEQPYFIHSCKDAS